MFLVRNYLPHILSARRLPPCIRSVDSPGQPTDEGSRIVISAQLRKGILDQLHTGHQGITKCHERARQACGGLVSGGNWSILSVAVLCAAKNKSDLKGPYPHRASHAALRGSCHRPVCLERTTCCLWIICPGTLKLPASPQPLQEKSSDSLNSLYAAHCTQ